MLFLPILLTLPWSQFPIDSLLLLAMRRFGIALGDSFYLAALRRLGTRRTLTVEAIGPVLASIGTVSLAGIPHTSSLDWSGIGEHGGVVDRLAQRFRRQRLLQPRWTALLLDGRDLWTERCLPGSSGACGR